MTDTRQDKEKVKMHLKE